METIADKIAGKCMDGLNATAILQEATTSPCMKASLLRNFDKTGDVKKNCPPEKTIGDFAACVIVGGFLSEVFSGYGGQPGPEAWQDLEKAKQEFGLIVFKKAGAGCMQPGASESALYECMFKSIGDHLQIIPDDEDKCDGIEDSEKRAACLGEAAMAEYLERTNEALQL